MQDDIRILNIDYHRNGISGLGFTAVRFKYEDDSTVRTMLATVTFDDLDCDCRVIDLANPSLRWRGDRFQEMLLAASPKLRKIKAEADKERAEGDTWGEFELSNGSTIQAEVVGDGDDSTVVTINEVATPTRIYYGDRDNPVFDSEKP
jgi:hypothetical protein